MNGVTVTAEES